MVWRHLASQLDSTQIAAHMYLSVNTVRTHVKSIYRKLSQLARRRGQTRSVARALLTSSGASQSPHRTRPAMPLRSSDTASRSTIAAATLIAFRTSQ